MSQINGNGMNSTYITKKILVEGGKVYGAKNNLLDSFTISLFNLHAPEFEYPEQELIFTLALGQTACSNLTKKQKLKKLFTRNKNVTFNDPSIIFDARFDTNANIAHVNQNQIGMVLMALSQLRIEERYKDVTFIMQTNTPRYIQELLTLLGFKYYLSTYGSFTGNILKLSETTDLKAAVSNFLNQHINTLKITEAKPGNYPEKLFICRRGARSLINEAEITELLSDYGYKKIFAEDLSVSEQLNHIYHAKSLFFIHGAAMSFAMYRSTSQKGVMIEAFSSGFSTNWGRQICCQSNDHWIGCQGKITTEDLEVINGTAHPRKHQAQKFELDVQATETAIIEAQTLLTNGRA